MKASISIVLSLLASATVARPRITDDEGDPLPQTSRVTAFVIDENGNPSVECWEFSGMTENQHVKKLSGSKGLARSMTLANKGDLDGLDILTWPSYSPIWPDPSALGDDIHADWFDFASFNSLFCVQNGLIQIGFNAGIGGNNVVDDSGSYTFSLENGDDWFYFEDNCCTSDSDDYHRSKYARSKLAESPPLTISTVSGSDTEVLRLRFPKRPSYKVLHKGGCGFAGISVPEESDQIQRSRTQRYSMLRKNDL